MPDDYSSIGGGLKLKGAGTGAGIKKKKKKKSTLSATASGSKTALQQALKEEDKLELKDAKEGDEEGGMSGLSEEQLRELDQRDGSGKTASERAHEETRRRRLNDRLKREGLKTHKERVEELNRYLSTLSEHHDMPRIGPG